MGGTLFSVLLSHLSPHRCKFGRPYQHVGAVPSNTAPIPYAGVNKTTVYKSFTLTPTYVKLVSHWAATAGDKLRTAFTREFLKGLQTFVGVLNFLARVAGLRSRVAEILNRLINSRDTVSLKIVTELSRVSRTSLSLVSVNQKVREM